MPDPQSGRRCVGAADGKIRVYLYIPESGDTVSMWVSPDLPFHSPDPEQNILTDVFGLDAEARGYTAAKSGFDIQTYREDQAKNPTCKTLRGCIQKVTGLRPEQQRLYHYKVPIRQDFIGTLREYGIGHGQKLVMRVPTSVRQQHAKSRNVESFLAGTRRKQIQDEARVDQFYLKDRIAAGVPEFSDIWRLQPHWCAEPGRPLAEGVVA